VFGESMSLRVAADEATVRTALKGVAPERFGFQVRPVWKEGLAAARGSTDFRLLFSGMAFMLAAAALLLAALSLALALEARKGEIALLRALGWSRGRVTRVLLAEGCVPLGVGALAGSCGGAFLARALVWSLGRFWRDAFAGAEPAFIFSFPVAVLAAGVSVGASLLVVLRSAARYAACPPTELWQAQGVSEPAVFTAGGGAPVSRATAVLSPCGGVLALAALAVMVWSPGGSAAHGAFFGAGFLLMLSLMLFMASLGVAWRRAALGRAASVRSPLAAGVSRALSVPRRSAPVVILLAVGLFLTVGILAMRHDPAAGCEHPWSGSGGFRAIVTAAVARDRARGLELAREASGATGVVPVRVREGDEAGCLNLNAPQTPRLLGLDTRAMARARAFEPREAGGVWSPLARLLPDGAIPVLAADQAMVQYSLKVKAGLTDGAVLTYAGADGTPWRVRIVGALPVRSGILQGALIMDERFFARMYPEEGYRMWLCDYAPYALREAADAARGRQEDGRRAQLAALRHPAPGVTVETVEERLRTLGAMEASYLDLFVVLGGLGLVLGAAGMALVILRGVEERRGEFALLGAVGVPWRQRVRLLAGEYGVLAAAGVVCGMLPALVAIQPAARALGAQLPWLAMGAVAAGLAGCLAVCVWGAARAAAGRFDPAALREL
jgi:predicted lysophospholipase L1 biosynthesis ABC-type transport system permease subunit